MFGLGRIPVAEMFDVNSRSHSVASHPRLIGPLEISSTLCIPSFPSYFTCLLVFITGLFPWLLSLDLHIDPCYLLKAPLGSSQSSLPLCKAHVPTSLLLGTEVRPTSLPLAAVPVGRVSTCVNLSGQSRRQCEPAWVR